MANLIVDLKTLQDLTTFSARMRRSIIEVVGGGKDGSVYKSSRQTVVKLVRDDEIYRKELAAYQLLRERRVRYINEFAVPRLLSFHDDLRAIEMTTVEPPFIVDFASAILDEDWREDDQLQEQLHERVFELFDDRAADVLAALERLATLHGIHLLDAHPANITF